MLIKFLIILLLPFIFLGANSNETNRSKRNRIIEDDSNFTNLVVFAKFKNESEFINELNNGASYRELVDNMLNESEYSLKDYYLTNSNNKVNIKSVYLFTKDGNSITLSKERGYYASKSEDNPIGYDKGYESLRIAELKEDWAKAVNDALKDDAKICDAYGNVITNYDLDKNKDGYIDSMNIMYKYSPNNISVDWASPLWNYQYSCQSVEINNNGTKINSNKYVQVTIKADPVYTDSLNKKIMSTAVITHEMGHVLGLYDLYSNSDRTAVGYMSSMGQRLSPIPQCLSIKEREALGWVNENQIQTLDSEGVYNINALKDNNDNQVIGYKYDMGNGYTLYLEYRIFASQNNKYDSQNKNLINKDGDKLRGVTIKSGLVCYLARTDVRFPNNLYANSSNWQYKVLGGKNGTRNDCALNINTDGRDKINIENSNISIEIDEYNEDNLKFYFSNGKVEIPEDVVVNKITIKNYIRSLKINESYRFIAEVEGTNIPENPNITWKISNNNSSKTYIDRSGTLYIGEDETSDYIEIDAIYGGKMNTVSVNIDPSHYLNHYQKVESTCNEEGHIEHWYCKSCDKYYLSDKHENEVEKNRITIAKKEHVEEKVPGTPSTCSKEGLSDGVKCNICNEWIGPQKVLPKLEHELITLEKVDATCEKTGLTEGKQCKNCGEIVEPQQVINALGHKEVVTKGKDATCVEDGLTNGKKCSTCNKVLENQVIIPALGHDEVAVEGKEATCTSTGLSDGTKCSKCNEVIVHQVALPKLEHELITLEKVDATCEKTGLTEGKQCKNCGEIVEPQQVINALGHKEVVTKGKDATCVEDGLTNGKKCSTCNKVLENQVIIPALGHDEVVVEGKEATCTSTGLSDGIKCSVCELIIVKQVELPELEHTIEDLSRVEPTCVEPGLTEGKKCKTCGEIIVPQQTINPLGHIEIILQGKEASCIQDGLTNGKKCSRCNEIVKAQVLIPALGHSEIIIKGKEATCSSTGLTDGSICSKCRIYIKKQEVIEKKEHTIIIVIGVDPTCISEGLSDGVKCKVCDEIIVPQHTLPKIGHSNVRIEGSSPSCSKDGLSSGIKCSICGKVSKEQVYLPKLKHKISEEWHYEHDDELDLEYRYKTCTICNAILFKESINDLGEVDVIFYVAFASGTSVITFGLLFAARLFVRRKAHI